MDESTIWVPMTPNLVAWVQQKRERDNVSTWNLDDVVEHHLLAGIVEGADRAAVFDWMIELTDRALPTGITSDSAKLRVAGDNSRRSPAHYLATPSRLAEMRSAYAEGRLEYIGISNRSPELPVRASITRSRVRVEWWISCPSETRPQSRPAASDATQHVTFDGHPVTGPTESPIMLDGTLFGFVGLWMGRWRDSRLVAAVLNPDACPELPEDFPTVPDAPSTFVVTGPSSEEWHGYREDGPDDLPLMDTLGRALTSRPPWTNESRPRDPGPQVEIYFEPEGISVDDQEIAVSIFLKRRATETEHALLEFLVSMWVDLLTPRYIGAKKDVELSYNAFESTPVLETYICPHTSRTEYPPDQWLHMLSWWIESQPKLTSLIDKVIFGEWTA